MTNHPSHAAEHDMPHGTLSSYLFGFVLSVCLTWTAFTIAPMMGNYAYPAIITAAIAQLFVQLIFFLHLGREKKSQWQLLMFVFTVIIIGIVIVGTLWIMSNLERLHMTPPTTTDIYQNGIVAPQNELH